MTARRLRTRARGFTLVELLVTLTLLGLFLAVVFGTVRLGTRAWESAKDRTDQTTVMEATHRFLRRTLSQAQPPHAVEATSAPQLGFEGRREGFAFHAPMPAHLAASDLAAIAVAFSPRRARAQLVARWMPDYARPGLRPELLAREVALADARQVEFAYFGRPEGHAAPQWLAEWREPARMPLLVRVRVVPADGEPWPDLVVTLRFAAEFARLEAR